MLRLIAEEEIIFFFLVLALVEAEDAQFPLHLWS